MERLNSKDFYNKLADLWAENPLSKEGEYCWPRQACGVDAMFGRTIANITLLAEDECQDMILFECEDGSAFLMYHKQDCCEIVEIDDINGDLDNLIGKPLMIADEATSDECEEVDRGAKGEYDESHTWTFYHFGTVRGFVDIRWYGESNGYYSESVDFMKLK